MRSTILRRAIGAARLDGGVYEDLRTDRNALPSGFLVVLLTSAGRHVGSFDTSTGSLPANLFGGTVGWLLWTSVAYPLGRALLAGTHPEASFTQLLRTTAFAASPALLRFLGFIPGLAGHLLLIAGLWMTVTTIAAVRHTFGCQTMWGPAVVTLAAWLLQTIALALFRSAFDLM